MYEKLLKNLEKIKGQELKYKNLCTELEIPYKSGEGKQIQLRELYQFCDIEVFEKPTRYIVTNVYPENALLLEGIKNNNKFQYSFDLVLFSEFLKKDGADIYLSKSDLLLLFGEVNSNFKISMIKENFYTMGLDELNYMADMASPAYRILTEWAQRRLVYLESRNMIEILPAYRLFSKSKNNKYIITTNVPRDTESHMICRKMYEKAANEVAPYLITNDENKQNWVDQNTWLKFKTHLDKLVKEETHGQFCGLKKIICLQPLDLAWLENITVSIKKVYNELDKINKEAQKKILSTRQLNKFTGEQREQFIDYNINLTPPLWFKEKLYKNS